MVGTGTLVVVGQRNYHLLKSSYLRGLAATANRYGSHLKEGKMKKFYENQLRACQQMTDDIVNMYKKAEERGEDTGMQEEYEKERERILSESEAERVEQLGLDRPSELYDDAPACPKCGELVLGEDGDCERCQ